MKITIFAATGGIGRQALDQAIAAGHHVTAVVRNPRNLSATPARIVTADLADADPAALDSALDSAVAGADAVLSCLGARSRADAEAGLVRHGTLAITAAMRAAGVRRIVVVSAAPVGTVPSPARPAPPRYDPGDGFLMRHLLNPIVKAALRVSYADLAQMEDVLRASDLDWTVVRPPRLTNKPLTGKPLTGTYRIAYDQNVRRGLSISRADVAHVMLRVLAEPGTFRRTVSAAR
jgi:putative NADH-flavin reductase